MNVLIDGEIVLYGTVGAFYSEEYFTALDVVQALSEIGRASDVVVRINSPGGIVDEGIAIYNAFKAHRGRVTVYVDSVAASSASVIAMAANEIVMRRGAIMMVHDPAGDTFGNVAAHRKSIETLEAYRRSAADIYAERVGYTPEQALADMGEEIWLTADDAVARGYADRVETADSAQANIQPTAFNYRLYQHAPAQLVAMADAKGWAGRPVMARTPAKSHAAAVAPPKPKTLAQRKPAANAKRTNRMADEYEVGDRVLVPVEQEDGATVYVEGEVTTVTHEPAIGITVDGQEAEEDEWFVDSELVDAPEGGEQPQGVTVVEARSLKRFSASARGKPVNTAGVRAGERKRISAIMDCDEAKGRESLARHFAMSTDMDAASAKAALKAAPMASAQHQQNRFDAAMTSAGNPQVGPDGGTPDPNGPEALAAGVIAAFLGPKKRSA